MAAYNGCLYVGTENWSTGGQVWEYNGTTWTQANVGGFGDTNNDSVLSMAAYNGYLYVGTDNLSTGVEVWEYDGTTWTQMYTDGFGDSNYAASRAMAVYNGNLYVAVGFYNYWRGLQIWEYTGNTWTQVSTDGFGDRDNSYCSSMAVYNGCLYAGTQNWLTGAQIWTTTTAAALSSLIVAAPTPVDSDQHITVTMTVTNTSGTQINGVAPSALSISITGTASATLLTGPTPAFADISPGISQNFTWTYRAHSGSSGGTVTFTGNASGTDAGTGSPVLSPTTTSNIITVTMQVAAPLNANSPTLRSLNDQLRPLSQHHIQQAEDLVTSIQQLIDRAKAEGKDIAESQELLDQAKKALEKANRYFAGGHYIAANYWALQAIELLTECKEYLNF